MNPNDVLDGFFHICKLLISGVFTIGTVNIVPVVDSLPQIQEMPPLSTRPHKQMIGQNLYLNLLLKKNSKDFEFRGFRSRNIV